MLAPAEGNAAVGDEEPVGGGRGDGEVFFAEVGEGGGELDGVGGAGVAVEPLPEGGRVQKFDFAVVGFGDFAALVEDAEGGAEGLDEGGMGGGEDAGGAVEGVGGVLFGVEEVGFQGGGQGGDVPGFAFFGLAGGEGLAVGLADGSDEEAFAGGFVGVEAEGAGGGFGGGDAGEGAGEGDGFGVPFGEEPFEDGFVLVGVVGAGAVNEGAAGAEALPDVGKDAALAFGAEAGIGFAPFGDGGGVFAEHAFAGAGGIDEDEVEGAFEGGEAGGVVVGDDDVVLPPFDDVFAEDGGAAADDFVGDEEAAWGEEGGGKGGFASRGGAEVEHAHGGGGEELPEDVGEEHGGGFLHVVYPAVEEGVEGEGGTFGEVAPFGTPGDRVRAVAGGAGVGGNGGFPGIEAYADGGGGVEGLEEGFGFAAELAADALFECGWQCVHVGLVFLPKMVDLDGISKYFSFECVFFVWGNKCVRFGNQIYFYYFCVRKCIIKKEVIMIIISTRDFRANQTKFLDMARNGKDIILKSRNSGSFKLVPVTEEDTVLEKRDLMEELRGALQQMKDHMEGKIELKTAESLIDELRDNSL